MNSYRKALCSWRPIDLCGLSDFVLRLHEMGQSGATLRGVLDYAETAVAMEMLHGHHGRLSVRLCQAERHRPRLILLERLFCSSFTCQLCGA